MLQEAIDLHRQGRIDEAETGYRAQLAAHPDDIDALHLLGRLRCQRGDFAEGAALLEQAHALAPEQADITLALASLRFCEGDHEGAARGFAAALAQDPNLAGAHAGIGQLALLRGETAEAERYFRTALRAGEQPQALAGLGTLLLQRGDLDAALRHLGRAAELASDDAMIQFTLGQAFTRRGTPAFAEQAFRNALRLRPDLEAIKPWLAAVLLDGGQSADAGTLYHELLRVPGFEIIALVGLADVARAEGRLEDAIAGYRAALAQNPAQPLPVRALAASLLQLGRLDEALAAYEGGLAATADDRLEIEHAALLGAAGRLPQAAAAWQARLERTPDDLYARAQLAQVSEQLGDFAAAEAQAQRVLSVREDADTRLLRVRSQLRGGDLDGAAATLATLGRLELDPAQTQLRWHYLGRVHDARGEAAEAVRCFAEAQRGGPVALPPLDAPPPELDAVLAEPAGAAWEQAPILLLGTPGSGVEQVAALLADQPGLTVLRDRAEAPWRVDDFGQPRFADYLGALDEAACAALRERWLAPLRAAGATAERPIVDWLPRWDAQLLALLRRAMPGTRLLIVERDPRDALLNWLAFGAGAGLVCTDVDTAADWLARAGRHLRHGAALDDPRRLVVAADALLDDAPGAADALARFLGLAALERGAHSARLAHGRGGLPTRFASGHWQAYRDALAQPFTRLLDA